MKYKAEDFLDELLTMHQISCSKCGRTSSVLHCDEYDACEAFFEEGWRKTKDNCYCPKCAKEKLKKLN